MISKYVEFVPELVEFVSKLIGIIPKMPLIFPIKAMRKPANFEKTCETTALDLTWRVLIGGLCHTPRMLFIGSRNQLHFGRFLGFVV